MPTRRSLLLRTPVAGDARNTARIAFAGLLAATSVTMALASPLAQAAGRLVDVRVIDRDTGRALPVHRHAGRSWIAGRPGARYAIEVRNRTGERVLAVTSVDGINVVSGQTAGWQQSGYVLAPHQRYAIDGWRKSDDEVAAFTFTSLGDAYATRTGRPAHVGVIGIAVFRERVPPPAAVAPAAPPASAREAEGAAGKSGAADAAQERAEAPSVRSSEAAPDAAARREKLGTGHGEREWSTVTRTRFERAHEAPDQIVALHYDSRDNLVAMGVLPMPRAVPPHVPEPFPHSPSLGYVPDPPARR